MIQKIYKVTCDNCSRLIGHYFDYKPSMKEIRRTAGAVRINNGKPRLLCKKCASTIEEKWTLKTKK